MCKIDYTVSVFVCSCVELEGAGTVFEGRGFFSTTTASGWGVFAAPGEGADSSWLLDPASSRDGQLKGSLLFFSRSSSAFNALCLERREGIKGRGEGREGVRCRP